MEYHHGKTICVSSQIGCKMGCKFCASTGIKFIRSLTAGEIVEQILAVEQDIGDKISNGSIYGDWRAIRQLRQCNEGNTNN